MNFVEYINLKGICKTIAGQNILDLRATGWDKEYPIIGKIKWDSGYLSPMKWNKEGNPHNLPLNHGLKLMAVVPRIEFDQIDITKITEDEYQSSILS